MIRSPRDSFTALALGVLVVAVALNAAAPSSPDVVIVCQAVAVVAALGAALLLGIAESFALLVAVAIAVSPAVSVDLTDGLSQALYLNLGPLPLSPIEVWLYALAAKHLRLPALGGWDLVSLSLVALFAAIVLAFGHGALSPDGDAMAAVRSVRLLVPLFLAYALAATGINTPERVSRVVNCILMAAVVKTVQGFYLKLTGTGLNYKGALRIFLGVELAALVFLLCYCLLRAMQDKQKTLWLTLSTVTVLVLMWSNARFVWVGGAVAVAAVLATAPGGRLKFVTLLLVSLAGGALFIGADDAVVFRERLASIATVHSEETNEIRVVETRNAWAGVLRQPILGNGFGVEYPLDEDYLLAEQSVFTERTLIHNAYLWLWFATGLAGVAAFAAAAGFATVRTLALCRRVAAPMRPAVAAIAGTLACCVVILVSGNWLLHQRAGLVIGCLLGCSVVVRRLTPHVRSASGYSSIGQRRHPVAQQVAVSA